MFTLIICGIVFLTGLILLICSQITRFFMEDIFKDLGIGLLITGAAVAIITGVVIDCTSNNINIITDSNGNRVLVYTTPDAHLVYDGKEYILYEDIKN